MNETVGVGIQGYGMGKYHADVVARTPGLRLAAVCDIDPRRAAQAREDFPGTAAVTDRDELLSRGDVDVVIIAVPHNAHAEASVAASRAGKHVVVEKPMAITAAECTAMIDAARSADRILTVHHNRRWDGDYRVLRRAVADGLIGDVYHVAMFGGGYHHPGHTWRADRAASGGTLYDWGAHYVDWLLGLVPQRVSRVTGCARKARWMDVTNEDDVQSWIQFDGGVTAHIQMSNLARVHGPRWRVSGTLGGIEDGDGGRFRVVTEVAGYEATIMLPYEEERWHEFYANLAAHLLRGEALAVRPEEARRVIAVMEATGRSADAGGTPVDVPYEA